MQDTCVIIWTLHICVKEAKIFPYSAFAFSSSPTSAPLRPLLLDLLRRHPWSGGGGGVNLNTSLADRTPAWMDLVSLGLLLVASPSLMRFLTSLRRRSTPSSWRPSNLSFCRSMVNRAHTHQVQARWILLHWGFDFELHHLPPATRRLQICRSSGVVLLSGSVAPSSTDASAIPPPGFPHLRWYINLPLASLSPSAPWWTRCCSGPRTYL